LRRWLVIEPRVEQEKAVPEVDQTSFHGATLRIPREVVAVADAVAVAAMAPGTAAAAADDRIGLGLGTASQRNVMDMNSRHIEVEWSILPCYKALLDAVHSGACLGSFP
jgi:hypothetical protein